MAGCIMRSLVICVALAPLLGPLAACMDDAKEAEEDIPVDGKLDSMKSPTDHGAAAFGVAASSQLTAAQGFHTWTFTLTGAADIHAFTGQSGPGHGPDTVLYLYKKGPAGWGSYVARNDDAGGTRFSSLTRSLPAGEYRALVKGLTARTRGKFAFEVDCAGAGCAAPLPPGCLFGATFNDARNGNPSVRMQVESTFTSPDGMLELDRQRVILAMHESSHVDVTTIEAAFAAADQHQINIFRFWEPLAARTYTAIEYGAGDNSYGGIYYWNTTDRVSSIHDGDLENCTVSARRCLLGSTYNDLRSGGAATVVSTKVVKTAAALSGVAADQALAAIRVAYADATSLADGFTKIDARTLNVTTFRLTEGGAVVDAYEYGAGDNSYGEVFKGGSLDVAAAINDGDLYGCAVLSAP
jgi:hypothetical protein